MKITIDARTLIEKAKSESGMNFGEMAADMGVAQARISEWRVGKSAPGTDEIAYFADKAGLPILETVIALTPRFKETWRHALASAVKSLFCSNEQRPKHRTPLGVLRMRRVRI